MNTAATEAVSVERIALVTDFGAGIYVGQVVARLSALVPGMPVIDLVHDLPSFRADLAAYLLPALVRDLPRGTLYLSVVDPGVGGERVGLVVAAGGDFFVGPDNGLLAQVTRRTPGARAWRIDWQPPGLSHSFHGRDWFAPTAARLCRGESVALGAMGLKDLRGTDWPDDLPAVIYGDSYGNLMTGMRASALAAETEILAGGRSLHRARTFCETHPGAAFWFENALGLVELAVNQGRADRVLGLIPGDPIALRSIVP
jgi:S-adenosyl-L-methionine hydrolase (adenosine-forming)